MRRVPQPPPRALQAVLWDFGGVITASPFEAFARYEQDNNLPAGFIRKLNATNPDRNAWARLERSEVSVDEFVVLFEAEAEAAGAKVDAAELLGLIRGEIRPEMVEAVRRCHDRLKTALLTNNFVVPGGEAQEGYQELLAHFDVVVESSSVGHRKPDPRFYEIALEALAVEPEEAVFLDDLGINLKPARALGMRTIKVVEPDRALRELEELVGFPLSDGN